jgi:hypothetical protein
MTRIPVPAAAAHRVAAMEPAKHRPDGRGDSGAGHRRLRTAMEPTGDRPDDETLLLPGDTAQVSAMEPAGTGRVANSQGRSAPLWVFPQWSRPENQPDDLALRSQACARIVSPQWAGRGSAG